MQFVNWFQDVALTLSTRSTSTAEHAALIIHAMHGAIASTYVTSVPHLQKLPQATRSKREDEAWTLAVEHDTQALKDVLALCSRHADMLGNGLVHGTAVGQQVDLERDLAAV